MTINVVNTKASFVGTGAPASYVPQIFVQSADQLFVRENGNLLSNGTDYTLTGLGSPSGVTILGTFPLGVTIAVERDTLITQDIDVQDNSTLLEEVLERGLDKRTMVEQELAVDVADITDRAIKVPVGEVLADLPFAADRKGRILGGNWLTGFIELLSYQTLANFIEPLLNVSFQGVPGPGNDLSTHVDTYAVGDGVTNDTAAFATAVAAAQAGTGRLRLGAKTYSISQLVIPAGVHVETAGVKTILPQRSGQPIGTPLVKIVGSNSGIESFTGIGNIATDASEFQHIVQVLCDGTTGSITNVRIGDIVAQDVRGDAVLVYQSPAAYAAGFRLSNVKIGFVSGDNIYRNGVSIIGGSDIHVAGENCTRVGLYSVDIEPDVGCGPGFGYKIGPVRGHWVAAISTNSTDCLDGVTFHSLNLSPAYATNSVPAYPAPTRYGALTTRNVKSVEVGSLTTDGHPGAAYKPVYNVGELADQAVRIASLNMKNMCTDVAETAWCWGAGDVVKVTIDHTNVDMGASVNEAVFRGINLGRIGSVDAKGTGGYRLLNGCADIQVGPVKIPANAGNILMNGSDRIVINGGNFAGDVVFSFSNDCQTRALTATATSAVDSGGNRNWLFGGSVGGTNIGARFYTLGAILFSTDAAGVPNAPSYQVSGNKVLGARGAAVANAVNAVGVPTNAEFNALVALFNALVARFRVTGGHGSIAD